MMTRECHVTQCLSRYDSRDKVRDRDRNRDRERNRDKEFRKRRRPLRAQYKVGVIMI